MERAVLLLCTSFPDSKAWRVSMTGCDSTCGDQTRRFDILTGVPIQLGGLYGLLSTDRGRLLWARRRIPGALRVYGLVSL